MAKRFAPLSDPVTIELDGKKLPAERGEPLAFSLVAHDELVLARSPKMHRPHGPTCFRGACDGCLARVDGEPNVMTCMVPCRGGERIEAQNVLGSRKVDLLRVTDWFFPKGMDHHHLLAGVPGLSPIMQSIARRVAGLGTLPEKELVGEPAERREVEVLVVGAGAAGSTVASKLASAGVDLLVVDDAPTVGGSLRAKNEPAADELLASALELPILSSTTAAGLYGEEALLVSRTRAILVKATIIVLATGAHDGVLAFENNDLPGIFSARAASLLAKSGIAVGEKIALVGDGPYAEALVSRLEKVAAFVRIPDGARFRARGRARVRGIEVEEGGTMRRHAVDAIAIEAPSAPAFELAEQAGAEVRLDLERGGYLPRTDEDGRVRETLYCAGEVAGVGSSLDAIVGQAERVAAAVLRALGRTG